jgi:pimeloyl-ACP methyl ester carboxylesterase
MQDAHLWSVHGSEDNEVPVAWDQNMAADMANNPNYKYTEVPGAGHDVWDDSQTGPSNPQYFQWLLQQEAPDPTTFQTQWASDIE